MTRRRRFDDEAVSTVVSAVLVFSLVTVVFAIYMSSMVPDQVADAEASHMRNVGSSLSDVASRISAATSLGREGEFSTSMDLGTTTLPGISLFHSSGSLSFEDVAYYSTFSCESPRLLARNQQAAPGGTYLVAGSTPFVFQSLLVLSVKVNGHDFVAGQTVTRTFAISAAGSQIGDLQVVLEAASSNAGALKVRARAGAPSSTPFYDQTQATLVDGQVYYLDLMTPSFGLSSILAEAEGPFTLTNSSTSAKIEAYALYWTPNGTLGRVGDGRPLLETFKRTVSPGSLVYVASNNQFMDQRYVLQGGALVLASEEGEYLTLPPFSVSPNNLLRLSLVDQTGTGSASGSHRATLSTTITNPTSTVLQCSAPTILTATDFTSAWHGAWVDMLTRSGYSEALTSREDNLVSTKLQGTWHVVLDEAQVAVRIS